MGAKIKNQAAIDRRVREAISNFKNNQKELEKAARTIQNELRATIREGKQADDSSFPPLKRKTIERRARLSTVNKTSKYYTAGRSNATLTGDLVRKLFAKPSGRRIEIFGKGSHKKYKGIRGKTLKGSDASISSIIDGFRKRGVTLLGVTDSARKRIRTQFLRFLRRRRK